MLKRILVFDENQRHLEVVKEALTYGNFGVKVTSNFGSLIETIKAYKPHLVILDYKQSGPHSDDICRKLKVDPQLSDTPVIICSAYLLQNQPLIYGCDDVINKPFGLDELLNKVTRLVVN